MPHRAVQRPQHLLIRRGRHGSHRGAGDDEAELVDRIGRVGHQDRVARAGDGRCQVRQPFLGAEGGDHLGFRVQPDVEAPLVVAGQRPPQSGNALADGIAMGARVLHRLDQLGDDVRRRRAVGIAHAEIDDVLAGNPGLRLRRVDLGEHVGRQAADAVELTGRIGAHGRSRGLERYCTRRAVAPRPIAAASTCTAEAGTPAAVSAAAMA